MQDREFLRSIPRNSRPNLNVEYAALLVTFCWIDRTKQKEETRVHDYIEKQRASERDAKCVVCTRFLTITHERWYRVIERTHWVFTGSFFCCFGYSVARTRNVVARIVSLSLSFVSLPLEKNKGRGGRMKKKKGWRKIEGCIGFQGRT